MRLDNGIVQGDLGGAVLIGEILVAYAAIPVGNIAILGASSSLGFGLGHRVTRGCDLFSLHGGYGLAVSILKCLAAGGAGVILVVAILGAGGGLGFGLGHRVTRGCNLFSLHGGYGLAIGILKNLTADGAGIIRIVAILGAGGFLGVGLGHRVMRLDNGIGQGGFVGAVLVGEIFVAYAAMPVGNIAVLRAGGSLGFGLGHRVTRGCNLFSLYGGYDLAVGILKCLAAGGAGVILVVAILGAGGGLGFDFGHRMARGCNLFSLHGGYGLAVGILKNLAAGGAGIILVVAVLGAGGSLGFGLGQTVTCSDKLFRLDGSFLRTALILENLTANRAGVVFGIAVLGTGGSFILGLGQGVGNFRGFFSFNRCFR